MLYLKPPFHIIEGTAVFADHANERQFYYMPAMPHLTTVFDPVANAHIPQIQLLKFRGGAGNGGLLTFEVNLGLVDGENRLAAIATELKRLHRLRDDPILAPVLPEDGTVRLIILGQQSANVQPVLDEDATPRFVQKIEHAAKPALYGDNQAIFSVQLDQEGVQLIEASLLRGELMPVGVVYSLDFFALRPAFTVKVTADWDRVQSHFEESFKADVLFSSTQIDTVVDKLVEEQVVLIEVDSFLPEGEDAGSWVGRRDQAINDFKDMVLETFFKPSLEPMKEEEDDWDKFSDTAERLSLLAATGGWGGIAKFSYVQKDLQRIDQKRVNLQMNERVTVKRSIYPQATLKGLSRVLRDGNIDPGRFIQAVDLDHAWFERRRLKVHSLVDFDNDNVDSVNVTLTYNGQPRTIRLTKDQPSGEREWNSLVVGNQMVRPVEYQYQVNFRSIDTAERPGLLVSPLLKTSGDEVEVSPRGESLYFFDDIRIGAGLLPWDRFPQVAVEVRYADPSNAAIRLNDTFVLSKDKPEATWKRFRQTAGIVPYDVRITFLAADHQDVEVDWTRTDQERLIIRDPRPMRRNVQLAPAVDWRLVAMLFVELRYLDEQNGVDEQQTLAFFDTPEDRGPKTFSVNLSDGNQRLVSYSPTFVLKDNRTIAIPRSSTAGSTIVMRTDMAGHRVVTVAAPDVDLFARGIMRIEVQVSYEDHEAGLAFADRFVFTQRAETRLFEFDYVAPERASYSCQVMFVLASGLTQDRDLGNLSTDRVVLPLG
jgi:hypothetical protein